MDVNTLERVVKDLESDVDILTQERGFDFGVFTDFFQGKMYIIGGILLFIVAIIAIIYIKRRKSESYNKDRSYRTKWKGKHPRIKRLSNRYTF